MNFKLFIDAFSHLTTLNDVGHIAFQFLRLHEIPQILISLLFPVLLGIRVHLPGSSSWHAFAFKTLRVVVSLGDASLGPVQKTFLL